MNNRDKNFTDIGEQTTIGRIAANCRTIFAESNKLQSPELLSSNKASELFAGEGRMSIVLRPGAPSDATVCGKICFEAFRAIDDEHNFPWDFPSAEVATQVLMMLLSNPGFYSVVAEKDGNVVGSNFLDERGSIAGLGRSQLIRPHKTRRSGAD